jgi:hypothetical protein
MKIKRAILMVMTAELTLDGVSRKRRHVYFYTLLVLVTVFLNSIKDMPRVWSRPTADGPMIEAAAMAKEAYK